MTNYDPKNYYYDSLYDRLWPKKFLIWSTMTHYDPIFFKYDPLWPTMTQKNLYYDPLWHTMTQKSSIMIHSMTHYDQRNF